MIVPLHAATDAARYGGKAAQLARAVEAGLPVPCGWALEVDDASAVAGAASPPAWAEVVLTGGPVAVRSSARAEDGATASHAGQFRTVLGVADAAGLHRAIGAVLDSARSVGVTRYRARLGLNGAVAMGVVIQRLVPARVAGVLFTRHPVSGADLRVVEASWGLGEAVVAGWITPDRWILEPGGRVVEHAVGTKDTRLVSTSDGSTATEPVPPALHLEPCLGPDALDALDRLATACDRVWPGPHDIEWAIDEGSTPHLLQRRPITTGERT